MKRLAAVLTLFAFLQACMHWGAKPLEPQRFDGTKPDRRVRVTLVDGEILIMKNPFISGDSLVWLRTLSEDPAGDPPAPVSRQGVPLRQIEKAEVYEVDAGRTAALVVGLGITAVLVAAAASSGSNWGSSSSGGSSSGGSCDACYSCPLVYSWDGHGWKLDSGTFGGAIVRSLARTDVDNLDFVRPEHGMIRLQLANH